MRHRLTRVAGWALGLAAAAFAAAAAAPPATRELTLDQAIALGLANNLAYQGARIDEQTAAASVTQAASAEYPWLTANYSYLHAQSPQIFNLSIPGPGGTTLYSESFTFVPLNLSVADAALEYAIYTGGEAQAVLGQAVAGLAGARSTEAAVRANTVRDVTTAYFALVAADRSAQIARAGADLAQQNDDLAQKLLRAGTAPRVDVLRQAVALASAQAQAIDAGNTAALADTALDNVLGIDLGTIVVPTEPLTPPPPAAPLDALLDTARTKRPELAAASDAVTIADLAIKRARAGALPKIGVQLSETNTTPNNVFNLPQPQFAVALNATWRLFDGGLTPGRLAEARAKADHAKLDVAQLERGIELEVRQAYYNYTAATARLAPARAGEAAAAENLRINRIRFAAGVGTSLELADALLADTQAQTQAATAQAQVRSAYAELQRAVGAL